MSTATGKGSLLKAKGIKAFWSGLPVIVQLLIIVVVVILIVGLLRSAWTWLQAKKKRSLVENNIVPITYTGVSGTSITTNIDVGAKAVEAHEALWGQFWGDEDEEAAISAVISTPNELIPELETLYFKLPGSHILKADLIKYCPDEWPSVSYKFK